MRLYGTIKASFQKRGLTMLVQKTVDTVSKRGGRTRAMVLCALFAALTAVGSQLAVPIQPIPINMAMLFVFLAGGLLGAKKAAVSMLVYVAIGAIGVPVFAGFRGGPQVLVGPTGGYILGYLVAASITGFAVDRWGERLWVIASAMVVGLLFCYAFGTLWFVILTGKGLVPALMGCVVPFLPGDAAKIIVASLLTKALRRYLR